MTIDPDLAKGAFYHRSTPDDAAWATARLRSMPLPTNAWPDSIAWRSVPSTYIICSDDRAIRPEAQRKMATNADRSFEIDSDHSPFLSCPSTLASLLAELASGEERR
jgi:hypothetical protein